MLEIAQQDFVRTARAKGLPEPRVVLRHQLRNALLSFITRFGLTFPFLLTGAVLVETMRRVGRVDVLRADPIGVLANRAETPVVGALRPLVAAAARAEAAPVCSALPQILQ